MDMNRIPPQRRAQILSCLCEGNSIRATCRMTGSSKGAVIALVEQVGAACEKYQRDHLRNLPCQRIQTDEVWSFVYAKAKNVPLEKRGKFGTGDVWTWTAICADSKLIVAWYVGKRDAAAAYYFMKDVAARLSNRVQLTTDGHGAYLHAVDSAFEGEVDYAMLVKIYGKAPEGETRYTPPVCLGAKRQVISGNPEEVDISTSTRSATI